MITTEVPYVKLMFGEGQLSIASQLLRTKVGNLAPHNNMSRIDVPNDDRNTYGWHQESPYNFNNLKGGNHPTYWMPLHDVELYNGSIRIKPYSHRGEMVDPIMEEGTQETSSRQLLINGEVLTRYKTIEKNFSFGGIVLQQPISRNWKQ